jgi:hypothetical protein
MICKDAVSRKIECSLTEKEQVEKIRENSRKEE